MAQRRSSNRIPITRLLPKNHSSLNRVIFSRGAIILLAILLEVLFIGLGFLWFKRLPLRVVYLEHLIGTLVVIYLFNSKMDAVSKNTWLMLMMLFPIFGSFFFLYTKTDFGVRDLKRKVTQYTNEAGKHLNQDAELLATIKENHPHTYQLVTYLNKSPGHFPIYADSRLTYYAWGDDFFPAFKEALLKAKSYIFLEYFIIDEGVMWGEILTILEQKVKEGVDVRVLYDGMVELSTLSYDYTDRMKNLGIDARAFAPIRPFLSTYYNYRDHRKITVIDGQVAFTGGVNLADEYINQIDRFGRWKDNAIKIEGQAVQTFKALFLTMWSTTNDEDEFGNFMLDYPLSVEASGYVAPYGNSPMNYHHIAENVYIDILNNAKDYVHIMTPYLVIDSEMIHALTFAAERGVEVSIIMPGIPDKPYAFILAETYFKELIDAGVSIYRYSPGFVHSKVFVSDGIKATVGTVNLDYRSLYHHFECGVYMYGSEAVDDVEEDFQETLKKCQRVTYLSLKSRPPLRKISGYLLKTIAPLL
ncbi:cardiolipin synthase [Streptococcus pluranimalium]|uniref:Cardiolipin synthase n=1 Tax=Streptococcus pluranimalium TaxID=82348 RepID=A0A2L0D4L1_9STRE|nr:cardiolipin synthase [Streptococcus pluranimalium]AUW96529.1 cardiolipin synthase [Streptococcus pluranimalium]